MSTATLHIEEKKTFVPQLRFSEFEGKWEKRKVGEIYKISAGGDIDSDRVSFEKTEKFKYPIYANAKKYKGFYGYSDIYKIEPGTITVAGRGVHIGIAHARDHRYYPIVRLLVLKPIKNEDIYFSENVINRLKLFIESTGVPQLTAPQFSNYKISIPSFPEQQKIASFLNVVDEKIQQLSRKKELLEEYKKGVMQQLFSGKLRFKDKNGEDYPDWEEEKLGDYLIKYSKKATENKQFPVLTSSRKGLYFQKDYFNGQDIASSDTTGYNIVPRGYFTYRHMSDDINFRFNINNLCDKGIVSTLYPVFTTNENLDDNFLVLKLNNGTEFKNYAILQKQGGSRTYMYFKKLEKLILQLPCLPEQKKIADFLTSIDAKIENVTQQINQAQNFKKGLLQQMFV